MIGPLITQGANGLRKYTVFLTFYQDRLAFSVLKKKKCTVIGSLCLPCVQFIVRCCEEKMCLLKVFCWQNMESVDVFDESQDCGDLDPRIQVIIKNNITRY